MYLKKNKSILVKIFILLIYIIVVLLGLNKIKHIDNYSSDAIQINRIAASVRSNWNNLSAGDYHTYTYPFTVLDADDRLIFTYLNPETLTLHDMMRNSDVALSIIKDGIYYGSVIIETHTNRDLEQLKIRKQYSIIMCSIMLLSLIVMLLYEYYLNKNILKPFDNLKNFSKNIALGNYDTPLRIKGNKTFLPLAQSLDIMRDELRSAKKRENEANQSKKVLVASLSHDIKTPITSIQLALELLEVKVTDSDLRERLHAIMNKTTQIDHLITDLFHTTMEDMDALPVFPKEVYSNELIKLIKDADLNQNVRTLTIPGCMIRVDSLRMGQVFTNIIYNSYKYANTEIDIIGDVLEDYLQINIRDYGPGVDSEDLPCIFNRFYRGSNVGEQTGSGLGLYICKELIEKMEGEIYCNSDTPNDNLSHNSTSTKGLEIIIKLPLA